MGPPTKAPNVFRCKTPGVLGWPALNSACLLNHSFDWPMLERLYSYSPPWKWLEPLFVTRLTCAPEDRPVSALELVVVTRNSCNESSGTRSAPWNAFPVN